MGRSQGSSPSRKLLSQTADHGNSNRNIPISMQSPIKITSIMLLPTPPKVAAGGRESAALLEIADSLGDIPVVNVAGVNFHEIFQGGLALSGQFVGRGH